RGSVQEEVVAIRTAAADADSRTLSGPPIKRIHATGLRAVAHVSAGDCEYKIDQHAPIQREVLNRCRLDDFSDRGFVGVEDLWNIADFYGLLMGFDAQLKIDQEALRNFKTKIFALGGKSGGADSQFVVPRLETGDLIDSLIVGLHFAHRARAF